MPKYARKKADTQISSNHTRDVNAPLRHNSVTTLNCTNEASERITRKSRVHSHWNNEDDVYDGNSSQVDIQSLQWSCKDGQSCPCSGLMLTLQYG